MSDGSCKFFYSYLIRSLHSFPFISRNRYRLDYRCHGGNLDNMPHLALTCAPGSRQSCTPGLEGDLSGIHSMPDCLCFMPDSPPLFFWLIPRFQPALKLFCLSLPCYPTLLLDCFWFWLFLVCTSFTELRLWTLTLALVSTRLWTPALDYSLRESLWFNLDWPHRIAVRMFHFIQSLSEICFFK